MFNREREAVLGATEAAKRGIDTSLVIACAALLVAVVAVVVAINHG